MNKLSKQPFFQGVMLWDRNRSGLSFENRRISQRLDTENMDAFFFAFHERKDVLEMIAEQFYEYGINSEIHPLDKFTEGNKQGYVLETERHPDFTEEYELWYADKGGLN